MMDIQDRITISTADIIEKLERNLDDLRRFRYDNEYRRLLGDTMLRHLENWESRIRSRRRDPFTVVVAGEFKRGKSTFINALLGEDVLVTDVTPETVTMNVLSYGLHKNEAVLSGGRRMTLSDDELSRAAIERISGEVGETIRRLEISRPNEILRDIRIIDTPGLNDISDSDLDSIVADAMAQADAVVYLYSVTAPLSRSEQMYIRYYILPQNYTKLFLVGNRCDLMMTADNLNAIRETMEKRTEILLPGERLYYISALEEILRATGEELPELEINDMLAQEFTDLKEAVRVLIEEKKTNVAADRMLRLTRQMVEELNADLENIKKGLEFTDVELEQERAKLREEESRQSERLDEAAAMVRDTVEAMRSDAAGWMNQLLSRMETENLSDYSAQELGQYYSYYCVDLLETLLRSSLEYHREELLEKLSGISDQLSSGLAGMYASGDDVSFAFRVNNTTWTRGDSVTMAISMMGGPISALADLVGSFTRKKEIDNAQGSIVSSIKAKFPALRKEADSRVAASYKALADSACKLIGEYYQEQIDHAHETMAQYEEASSRRGEDHVKVLAAVEELGTALAAFSEQL